MDLNQAIAAHAQWKQRFRSAIADGSLLPAAEIRKDDQCELGCWLYGAGGHQYGHLPQFVDLLERHRVFHQEAARIAERINAGSHADAMLMLDGPTAYGQATVAIGAAVHALRQTIGST